MNRHDPRIRQTLNRLTDTLESANLNTQASLFTFSEQYVQPCLASVGACWAAACAPCCGGGRPERQSHQRQRRRAAALRGRPEFVFDFYNDEWEEEGEHSGLLGSWGADELERLLVRGSGGGGRRASPPRRPPPMNYGARTRRRSTGAAAAAAKAGEADPTVVPNSSMFGFLERLPWRSKRGRRYTPSAAGLQEHPGWRPGDEGPEAEALLSPVEAGSDGGGGGDGGNDDPARRPRRDTHGSGDSSSAKESLSSRGDLFLSEDEAPDAVPLDDAFAMVLARRRPSDETGSGKSRARRSTASRTTTASGQPPPPPPRRRESEEGRAAGKPGAEETVQEAGAEDAARGLEAGLPTAEELAREEAAVRREEEAEVRRKRREAQRVAMERGLSSDGTEPPQSPPPPASPPVPPPLVFSSPPASYSPRSLRSPRSPRSIEGGASQRSV